MSKIEIRQVAVTQYLKPLREGGSLPAIVKANDDFLYVMKFHGAGQGKKALIAELIGAELARAIGLKIPEIVFLDLDQSFGKTEPDEEIQDLLNFSVGLNLGLHFLSGAITYDPLVSQVDALTASKVVLLDSMINNIDRTAKNTNLLIWNNELWLIDHGASLYFHHNWKNWESYLEKTFPAIQDHVLLAYASDLSNAADEIQQALNDNLLEDIIVSIPDDWLIEQSASLSAPDMRNAYLTFLKTKRKMIHTLAKEAEDAR